MTEQEQSRAERLVEQLPQHWMAAVFRIMLAMELHQPEAVLQGVEVLLAALHDLHSPKCWPASMMAALPCPSALLQALSLGLIAERKQKLKGAAPAQMLLEWFPDSTWLVAQAATAQYNLRNFDQAQALFEELIRREPHRVEVRTHARGCKAGMPAGVPVPWTQVLSAPASVVHQVQS